MLKYSFVREELTSTGQTIRRTTGTVNSRLFGRAMMSDIEIFSEL